jgi:serine/threonine protein kinase
MAIGLGTRLGPYEILAPIGAGGMGQVWKARDTRLGRIVAVKVLPAELSSDAKLRVRFDAEAKAISALSHPHICALYDVGPDYLVMEHCEGKTLAKRLRGGPCRSSSTWPIRATGVFLRRFHSITGDHRTSSSRTGSR